MDEVITTLTAIARLLRQYRIDDWAVSFEGFAGQYPSSSEEVRASIKSTYGGMGSFSDIVLQDNDGSIPSQENEKLECLRLQLYRLCTDAT